MIDSGSAANRIHWTGMVKGDVKWGAFRCAEAFILPSHQENFGIALVEGMACGLPVMTTRRVNIWREIESDGAGFVEEDTLEGTRSLLRRWIQTSPTERAAMSKRAVASFRERYTVEQSAESLIKAIAATGPKSGGSTSV
jgi:glycosyltransferase involved in cell wall biosynthesis